MATPKKKKLTKRKARKILRDGQVRGNKLTKAQRGFFRSQKPMNKNDLGYIPTLWDLRGHIWWNFKARFFWGPVRRIQHKGRGFFGARSR